MKVIKSLVTYRAASIGSLDFGQVLHVGVEYVHLLNQAGQGSLGSLTDLLVDLLGLDKPSKQLVKSEEEVQDSSM